MRSTSGPTFVYGALTISYSCAKSAPYQLDRSSGEITTSNPASFAVACTCSNSDCSAGIDWFVLTGKRSVSRAPSFMRVPSLSRSVQPASSSRVFAASRSVSKSVSSEYASGSTDESGEYERSAVPKKSESMPSFTSTARMNASRTRSSSNGAWPEFSSMRFEAPGRGASSQVNASSPSAAAIVSGWGLSITSTCPPCSAA